MRLASLLAVSVSFFVICGPARADDDISEGDKSLLGLVKGLAQDPHLMDPGYLSDKLGIPDIKWQAGPWAGKVWNWVEPVNHAAIAKLEKRGDPSQGSGESKLTLYVPSDSNIPINSPALESVYGQVLGQQYDQSLNKTSTFSLSKNTTVTAVVPPNGFTVKQLEVNYQGPELPPLNQQEVNASIDDRRAKAFDLVQKGQYDQALPLLVRHIQVRPTDAEARAKLADTYKGRCCLNQAIDQYRLALQFAGDDKDLRQHCIDGLRSLKVVSDGQAETPGRTMLIAQPNNNANPKNGLLGIAGNRLVRKQLPQQAAPIPEFDPNEQDVPSLAGKGGKLDPGF